MKFWRSFSLCLAAGGALLAASQPWTVDALMRIPSIGDPQIRPDGQAFAYTLRAVEGNTATSSVYLAPIPAAKAQRIGAGSQPRWSPDSKLLAW
ncbi:MAG TPA: hypothetical protein VG672_27835, partial [Bryobacteraceae bacterium]|nr:hypothetical protein [Bryobacteraceae bacterium]